MRLLQRKGADTRPALIAFRKVLPAAIPNTVAPPAMTMVIALLSVLCALYASEIKVSVCISSCWDEGWEVKLGDRVNGFVAEKTFANAELDKAAQWLAEQASVHYPESDFARRFTQFRSAKRRASAE
jgi:hypothetical protein